MNLIISIDDLALLVVHLILMVAHFRGQLYFTNNILKQIDTWKGLTMSNK